MRTVLRRPLLAFVLGAALVGAGAAGTAAYGALDDDRVTACYAPRTGALFVVGRDGAPSRCADGLLPIDWSVKGPQGPAGVFSGTFTSPSGAYSISVTDAGIVLAGPGSSARLVGSTLTVETAGATTVQAGTTVSLASGTGTTVQAGTGLALASSGATSLQTGKNLSVATGKDLAVSVAGVTSVGGQGDVTIESSRRATLRGTTGVVVESDGPVSVSGAATTVKASGLNLLKGAVVQANGTPIP